MPTGDASTSSGWSTSLPSKVHLVLEVWWLSNRTRYGMIGRKNIGQFLNSQKAPHSSPSQVSYGESAWYILEKIHNIVTGPHWTFRARLFSKSSLARLKEFWNFSICLYEIKKKNLSKSTCPTGSFTSQGRRAVGNGEPWPYCGASCSANHFVSYLQNADWYSECWINKTAGCWWQIHVIF